MLWARTPRKEAIATRTPAVQRWVEERRYPMDTQQPTHAQGHPSHDGASRPLAETRAVSSRERTREISRILARHGLGYLVDLAGWDALIPFHRGLLGHPQRALPYTRPEHVRMAFEELGTVAIKLGQMLSTRPDLLPPAYQRELALLQDAVPPVSSPAIRQVVVAELGRPVEDVYASFEETPLASASIGQVHAATLLDGADVIIKVRRPGVVSRVEADLAILERLARQAANQLEVAAHYDVQGLVAEFAQTLRAELDYRREAQNAERFARNFADDALVTIPRVYRQATTAGVLTLSRLHGIKISDTTALDRSGHDREELAERAARIVLRMVFEHGFYHADPHPGNFVILPDGAIGLMDFGMVGTVSPRLRRQLASVMIAVALHDTEQLVDALLEMGFAAGPIDRGRFSAELERLLARTYDVPLGEIALTPLLQDLLALLQRYRVRLPPDLSLLFKTMLMNESVGTLLDPSFQSTSVLVPYARKLVRRQYAPEQVAREILSAGDDLLWLGTDLPRHVRRLTSDLERGSLSVGLQPAAFEPIVRHVEQIANRLTMGMLAAAFVVGLAVLMAVYHPGQPVMTWLTGFFFVGLVVTVLMLMALMWMMLRSRRD